MSNKDCLFFLNDIQDIWLMNCALLDGSTIIYNSTSKKTSPHRYLDKLSEKFNLIKFDSVDSEFIKLMDRCEFFVTKECMPINNMNGVFKNKVLSLSWCGESAGCKKIIGDIYSIKDSCRTNYVEKILFQVYEREGIYNNCDLVPKYYFLNGHTRESICGILGVDPNLKYVTILANPHFESSKSSIQILENIIGWSRKRGFEIVTKNKIKYGTALKNFFGKSIFFQGDDIFYHQTLLLMAISEYTVSFTSAASIEAAHMGTTMVNFWRSGHYSPKNKNEYNNDEAIVNMMNYGYSSNLAHCDNIFHIYYGQSLREIDSNLFSFLSNRKNYDFSKRYDVDPVFKLAME